MSDNQESNKISYQEGIIERRVKMMNNPFLNITLAQIKVMQRNLEGVNKTISQASMQIQPFATKNDIERLEETINLLAKQNLLPTKEIEQNTNNCEKLTWLSLTNKGLILNDTFLYHTL